MAEIGQEIRRVREERGLNQTQLAVLIGTGPAAISRIENGRQTPSMTTLEKIAEALGVELADLFPKAQTPLPLEDSRRHGGEEAAGEGRHYNAFETLGRVLAMSWTDDLEKWDEKIPDGTSPDLMDFGRLLQWALEIGGTRSVYNSIAAREQEALRRDQLEDTLRLLEAAEREALAKLKRAFEPAKTYAAFKQIWEASDMDAVISEAESR